MSNDTVVLSLVSTATSFVHRRNEDGTDQRHLTPRRQVLTNTARALVPGDGMLDPCFRSGQSRPAVEHASSSPASLQRCNTVARDHLCPPSSLFHECLHGHEVCARIPRVLYSSPSG